MVADPAAPGSLFASTLLNAIFGSTVFPQGISGFLTTTADGA